ncbi:hypothetical protein ACIPVB_01820 [Microbacterium sp. NPDC090007]|uniref:hypothetical protein n=1 Tax=Microbacterium sp. NPDC090007 TaxID=3364204 RepID=UPI00381F97DA
MGEEEEATVPVSPATIQDRIAAFEMLDRMHEATQAQKTYRLSLVGFKRADIAAMLNISVASVSQNIYTERNKGKKKPVAKKTAAEVDAAQ